MRIAWANLGGKEDRIEVNSKKQTIPIRKDYIDRIEDDDIRRRIFENSQDYNYKLSVDKQIFIDGKMIIGIECKSYAENAMLKRILVDFAMLKTILPNLSCYLFQLESQLGGDHSELKKITFGSRPSHTLMSYFPSVRLHIFTFLKGERKVKKPIHKPKHFKPLKRERVEKAISVLENVLRHVR